PCRESPACLRAFYGWAVFQPCEPVATLRVCAMHAELEALLPAIAEREARDSESYPKETIDDLLRLGIHSGPLPRSLGGGGWPAVEAVHITERLAAASPSAALMLTMPMGLAGIIASDAGSVPEAFRAGWHEQ